MTSFAQLPRNEAVLREFGPYPRYATFGVGTTQVQRIVRERGLHAVEPGTQATLLALVQLSGRRPVEFFDIGAHVGFHSLMVASIYPAGSVHVTAFEPTPHTSAACRSNAGRNRLSIRIEQCAISDADGSAEFYISPWESSNSLAAGFREAVETFRVPTVRLDSYCAQRDVWPDVVKIDVETYESHVLAGAERTLRESRPSVVCEILPATDPAAIDRTVRSFAAAGYAVHRQQREGGWSECAMTDVLEMIAHDGSDWLFTPQPVDATFRAAYDAWRAAIAACTADTTLTSPPAAYPAPMPSYDVPRGRASGPAGAPGAAR